ncbi:MAG: deoxyribonuclease IV [bacterium]|nr:deoxyribonuclease IV [bacterium]
MSIAGGFERAIERARGVDGTALQIFVKSARQWKARPVDLEEARRFRRALRDSGLRPFTMAHASYLINLASPDEPTWRRSIEALGDEVERCALLGVPYLVLHPGSHVGSGEDAGLDRVAAGLDLVLGPSLRERRGVSVLLETTAGQGTNLGARFEHLGRIVRASRVRRRLGVCVDTCHVLAAGYALSGARAYARTIEELDAQVGLGRVKAFHLNDSKFGLGSRRDRHEHIGEGEVGLSAFRSILRDDRFRDVPMVLETPKGEGERQDLRNMATLRGLLPKARR